MLGHGMRIAKVSLETGTNFNAMYTNRFVNQVNRFGTGFRNETCGKLASFDRRIR